jgi:hypothetical protein
MKLMTGRMFEEALRRFQCVFAKPFARTQLVELCAPLFRVEAGWLEAKRLSGSSRSTTQGAPRRKLLLRWHLLEEILQALRTLPNSRLHIEGSIFSGHETGCRLSHYIDFLSNFAD